MTITEAVQETIKKAVSTGKLCYTYKTSTGYKVSSVYEKDWLFQAYPGGRKILSSEGKKEFMQVVRSLSASDFDRL